MLILVHVKISAQSPLLPLIRCYCQHRSLHCAGSPGWRGGAVALPSTGRKAVWDAGRDGRKMEGVGVVVIWRHVSSSGFCMIRVGWVTVSAFSTGMDVMMSLMFWVDTRLLTCFALFLFFFPLLSPPLRDLTPILYPLVIFHSQCHLFISLNPSFTQFCWFFFLPTYSWRSLIFIDCPISLPFLFYFFHCTTELVTSCHYILPLLLSLFFFFYR